MSDTSRARCPTLGPSGKAKAHEREPGKVAGPGSGRRNARLYYFRHSIGTVKLTACSPIIAASKVEFDGATAYLTAFTSRKVRTTDPLIAKFTFCGMSPVFRATGSAFTFPTTTQTTFPVCSSNGPPLFPGWTGAVIWNIRESSPIPANALTTPVVILAPEANKPITGNPTTTTARP